MKTSQVFVSHTSDMAQFPQGRSFVQAALDAVGRARLAPVDMRYFAARDGRPADYCQQQVRACDIYVAVIGFRYGSLVAGEGFSYTELEFLTAGAEGLPRLVFLLAETACPAALADDDRELVQGFRQRLADAGILIREFTSSDALELEVFHALSDLVGNLQRVPRIWNVPNRNADFTGRMAVLEELHDGLAGDGMAAVLAQALYGLGGVGKTQVALEYAHSFMGEYDLIWWIAAEQAQAVSLALAELAGRLGYQGGDNAVEAAAVALDRLRRGVGGQWLLVFDNAEEPADLEPFFPGGIGHVIITSRNHAWARHARPVELDVFTRAESIAHLTQHVPNLDSDSADRIAAAVGDLPLAVEQAAAWLAETGMPGALYLERLETRAADALGLSEPLSYAMSVATTWNLSLQRLRERSPAAVRLLQILAFCAAEPIPATLLYGDEMNAALLPFDAALADRLALGKIIREANRLALIKVHRVGSSVQMHRLVQAVIRSQMTAAEQVEARHTVHTIVAGALLGRGDANDPANWLVYDIIWPHLEPSRAEECDDERTRQLLIDWARYQRLHGELASGLALAVRLERLWQRQLGPDHQQTLRIQHELANLLREQGRYRDARDLDAEALRRQRASLGSGHHDSLASAYALAADLRALGDFRGALALDLKAYASFREQCGLDHPRTLQAAHNLACSQRLVGDFPAARRLDEQTLELQQRVLGPSHLHTLNTATMLGLDLRETGALRESVEHLRSVYEQSRTVLGDETLQTLSAAMNLAVSLRRVGELDDATRLTQDTYDRYLKRFGPEAPSSLSCALNLASDYAASGDHGRALGLAEEILASYEGNLDSGHADRLAARNNIIVYLRETGDLVRALALAEQTVGALSESFGPDHPYSLCCTINLANCLADALNLTEAESLQRETIPVLRRVRGPEHPDTVTGEANLAVTLRRAGNVNEAEKMRTQTLSKLDRILGPDHPDTALLRNWRFLNSDIDPSPF
jgi:tetratricopeptide (TPR) repeat protein